MTRRELLSALGALALAPALAVRAQSLLKVTCPELGPEAVAEMIRVRQAQPPPAPQIDLAAGRKWLAGQELSVPQASWRTLPGGVRVRVLRPPRITGVYLFMHGGGWCMGTAVSGEAGLWELAQQAQVAVVSVDYRLAPEHPFPQGPEDCLSAARWLIQSCRTEFGSPRLLIGGCSAGAHLASLTASQLPGAFSGAVLLYGVYDLSRGPAWRAAKDQDYPALAPSALLQCVRWFVPGLDGEALRRGDISPLYARLAGLPPALFLVGERDVLLEDSQFMAARWANSGSPAELVVYPEAFHGFDGYPVAMARDARERMLRFIGCCGTACAPPWLPGSPKACRAAGRSRC